MPRTRASCHEAPHPLGDTRHGEHVGNLRRGADGPRGCSVNLAMGGVRWQGFRHSSMSPCSQQAFEGAVSLTTTVSPWIKALAKDDIVLQFLRRQDKDGPHFSNHPFNIDSPSTAAEPDHSLDEVRHSHLLINKDSNKSPSVTTLAGFLPISRGTTIDMNMKFQLSRRRTSLHITLQPPMDVDTLEDFRYRRRIRSSTTRGITPTTPYP